MLTWKGGLPPCDGGGIRSGRKQQGQPQEGEGRGKNPTWGASPPPSPHPSPHPRRSLGLLPWSEQIWRFWMWETQRLPSPAHASALAHLPRHRRQPPPASNTPAPGCTAGPGSGWRKSLILVRLAEQGSPPTSAVSEVLTVPPQTPSHPKAQVKLLYGRVPGPGETGSTKPTKPRRSGAGAPCAWRDRTGRDRRPPLDLVFGEKTPQEAVKTISPSLLLR